LFDILVYGVHSLPPHPMEEKGDYGWTIVCHHWTT